MKKVIVILLLLVLAFGAWKWITFPDVAELAEKNPKTTAFMELRKKQLRRAGKSDELQHRWVKYDRISPYLRRAVLVSEDNAFYEHEGFDVEGIKDAVRRDWERRRLSHGGSTITQQLAKNLYLSPSKNPLRKLEEAVIAWRMEQELSKKRILEIYLNVVEFGERVYGAEAAAQHYFGKSASALTPREAALLAGALPNPRKLNPADPTTTLRKRQRIILARMRRWGITAEKEMLTEKKVEEPKAAPPELVEETDTSVPDEPQESDDTATTDTATAQEPPPTETTTTPVEPPVDEPPPATETVVTETTT
ncbi:MAG: monofunctional biosynthetic peptidoglycan transglycosylase [Thermoanaerobaculia bacterium]